MLGSVHPSLGGQPQELLMTSGAMARVGVLVVEVGGGDEELVALGIGRRGAVSLVHVAAADPLGRRRHPDLVADAVVTDDGAHGVGAVAVVVARFRRVGAAAAAAGVDGVVPVVGVVARSAAVLVDQGRVVPEIAGVLTRDHGAAAGDAGGPDIVGVDQGDVPLDGFGRVRALSEMRPAARPPAPRGWRRHGRHRVVRPRPGRCRVRRAPRSCW